LTQARVLVASGEEVMSRSLETILTPAGFTVVQAFTGQSTLDAAREVPAPDAFIIDLQAPDLDGLTVCRALRADHYVTPGTPIILITASPATRQTRIDALRAGASDLRSGPLDAEEFVLDLQARLAAKFDGDQARLEGLTDTATGVYNMRGLERKAHEVAAGAARHHAVFGCAAFVPETGVPETGVAELGDRLARAFHSQARTSDALGRVGPLEFIVLAPETDAAGAARLAERLGRAVESVMNENGGPRIRLRTAFYALAGPPTASLDPLMPVARARAALGTIRAT
jgi:PleD family two-component response regulator